MRRRYDAVVVGSGPNGLAAAITLARAGRSVLVRESSAEIGGGLRCDEHDGAIHDVCASVLPLAVATRFFRTVPLAELGFEWVHPRVPLACPLPDGRAAVLERRLEDVPARLGADGREWARVLAPFARRWTELSDGILGPIRVPPHARLALRFGRHALRSAHGWSHAHFADEPARLLFESCAAHAMLDLERSPSAAYGLVLVLAAHAVGWPFARGGARELARALATHLRSLGGEIETEAPIASVDEALALGRIALFGLTARRFLALARERLPDGYRRALENFRDGPGVFKVDWTLHEAIPWRAPECAEAGTVHVAGSTAELAACETATRRGEVAERPFLLVTQPSTFDPTRARDGRQVAWAYFHVPNGSTVDMTERIEAQMERFAPGFRNCVARRVVRSPAALERHDANLVGGDISGGMMTLRQLFFRPAIRLDPYRTPLSRIYLCSSSTPPGGGVHGLCGYFAARAALRA